MTTNLRPQHNTTSGSMASTLASEKTRRSDQIGDLDADAGKGSQKDTSEGELGYSLEIGDEEVGLEQKAKSILKHTGLRGSELDQRVDDFQRTNQGRTIQITCRIWVYLVLNLYHK